MSFLFTIGICFADESIKTISYTPCIEVASIYNSLKCQYFTSFFANIDVIGGGSFSQELDVVGNPVERTLDIPDNNIGAIQCPEGVGCTNLDPPVTVSFVRSPIPDSQFNVLPGAGISFGLAYALTQDTQATKSGLPYAYQIYAADPGAGLTDCPNYATITDIPILSSLDNTQAMQPDCGTGPIGSVDLRNTCGNPSLAPLPTGWLSDNNGQPLQQCMEMCCGNSDPTSIRVRQLAPTCFLFRVNPVPVAVVDFLVEVTSSITGTIIVPIYGAVTIQEPIVINQNGLRITINSNVRIPPTALQNKVQNGWIFACGDDPDSALPDETQPVTDIADINWAFQPSDYTPYYSDATAGQGNVVPPITNDPHTEYYGESGNDVLNLGFNFVKNIPGFTVADCLALTDFIPNVPGYDTDHPITAASPFNLPSYCNMWHEARSGNLGFLPPSAILPNGGSMPFFNWMVKRSIASVGDLTGTNGQAYAIFFPSADQIAQYRDQLTNALQIEVDFAVGNNPNYVTEYGDVNLPVQIVQPDSTRPNFINGEPLTMPNCMFAGPTLVPSKLNTGGGQFLVQLESTLLNNQVNSGNIAAPVSDINVVLACSPVAESGADKSTPTIQIIGSNTIFVPSIAYGGLSDPLLFNLSATFLTPYSQEAVDNSIIATCSVTVIYNMESPDKGSFTQDNLRCQVFANFQSTVRNLSPCPWWNLNCQDPLVDSWFFWIAIFFPMIILGLALGFTIHAGVKLHQERKQQAIETERVQKKERLRNLEATSQTGRETAE